MFYEKGCVGTVSVCVFVVCLNCLRVDKLFAMLLTTSVLYTTGVELGDFRFISR